MNSKPVLISNQEIDEIKNIGRRLFQDAESTSRIADTQIYFILKGLHKLLLIKGVTPSFTVEDNTDRYEKNYEGPDQ